MKRAWGSTVNNIIAVLSEIGEGTSAEVASELGMDRMNVATIMSRMRKPGPVALKRIYVVRYIHDHIGSRRYPRPVYALGDKDDAKKPRADVRENRRRYRANLRKRMTGNSVFNLGLTRREFEATLRAAR